MYCLSNKISTTGEDDDCKRRSNGGIITIKCPQMITKYNEFMGGVDVADKKRLHSNSTIMGLNRWWLKLFFYLLDVGTANANVIYNETLQKDKQLNISDFKLQLVNTLVGQRIAGVDRSIPVTDHIPIRIENRRRCAHCALFAKPTRTRFICQVCMLPLCSIGNGKTGSDCFTLAHESETIHKMVAGKFEAMKNKTNCNC